MNLQTDDAFGQPGENFLVARYSRDVLGRSQIGGIVINKQATSGRFNRTYAADMNLALTSALTVDGFIAGTSTRGTSGDELAAHFRAGWLDQSWRIYTEYTDLGDDFNPEVGFVPRVGIRRSKVHLEFNPRPGKWGIRMMDPMWNVLYITDQTGRLVTRRFHHMVSTTFENGANLDINHNRYFERIDNAFSVGGVAIDPGEYWLHTWSFSFRSNPSRRFFYRLSYSPQTFYDGNRTDLSASVGLRVTDQLATSASISRNDVEIPNGGVQGRHRISSDRLRLFADRLPEEPHPVQFFVRAVEHEREAPLHLPTRKRHLHRLRRSAPGYSHHVGSLHRGVPRPTAPPEVHVPVFVLG